MDESKTKTFTIIYGIVLVLLIISVVLNYFDSTEEISGPLFFFSILVYIYTRFWEDNERIKELENRIKDLEEKCSNSVSNDV